LLHKHNITDHTSFLELCKSLTETITSTASKGFYHTKPYIKPKQNIMNPKIKGIAANLQAISGAICFEKLNRTVHVSPKAMEQHRCALLIYLTSHEEADILRILTKNQKVLHKSLYAE
jgi:hypothetical protein